MQVIINVETLEKGTKDIFGEIYLQTDDFIHPTYAWTDFVVVLLCWWAEAATMLHYSDAKSPVKLLFMDGPYFVQLNRLDDHTAHARFMHRGQHGTSQDHEQHVDLDQFMQSLKKAIQQVINKCQREGWQGRDVAALENSLKSLNNLTSQ